jgi:RHS repeat-associated protein
MTHPLRPLCLAVLALPIVAVAQNYEGYLDGANCSVIGGWAADANQPNTPISVDIYDGNALVTTTVANAYRADLGFVGYYHGFTITTPASLKNNAYHYIIAKYGGTQLQLGSSDVPLYCTASSTGYQYYYSDTFSSINSTAWYENGTITTSSAGLTSPDLNNGGSVISKAAVPDGTSEYEVKATLALTQNGGAFGLYLRGTSNALVGPRTGSYYAFEIQNPTFSGSTCSTTWALYKQINGSISLIGGGSYSCHNGMVVRLVYTINSWIVAYIDNVGIIWITDGSIGTGQPGVGVRNSPAGNGIARVDLGPHDNIAPTVMENPITSSGFPDHIDLKWGGSVDDPNGIGLWSASLSRNSVGISSLQPGDTSYSDYGIPTNTSTTVTNVYTYQVTMYDYHLNSTTFSFNASSPPAGSIDPRQVGVRPLGSYWGGGGEQIDMRSGNLNYSKPLIKAQSRGGWSVGFNLSYNSQNWRNDPAGVWQLGRDTGYGYGWRLQAGSLTPIYNSYWNIGYWLFIDSNGGEYKLNQWNGSVWTSLEGIYLTFDPVAGRLYFPDGSFWICAALSAGTEQDAGTYYPTLIEDTNGNQILLTYKSGLGVSYSNSSARIATIEDVRGKGVTDYSFTYNTDPIPHLTTITNGIGTPENYTLAYLQGALIQPFASISNNNFGTFKFLQSVEINGPNLTTSFTYNPTTDPNTNPPTQGYSGELTQMTTPYGGHLRWAYTQYTLSGSRTFREVQNRYLLMCASSMAAYCSTNGRTEMQYQIARDPGDSSRNVHNYAWLIDYGGNAAKVWNFQTNTAGFDAGLQTAYMEQLYPAPNTQLFHQDFYWAQTPTSLNPYIATNVTKLDPGQSYQAQKQTTQTLDQYGNLLAMQVYDFGNLSTPVRYYTNTYLTDSNYISRHIVNRLVKSTVANAATCSTAPLCTTLVQNYYDNQANYGTCVNWWTLVPVTGSHEHDDANYNQNFYYRGNLVSSTTPPGVRCASFDMTGNPTSSSAGGVTTTATTSSSTNYAAPYQITTNTLSSTMNWYSSLSPSSAAGPNGDTASFAFDTNGRPLSTTSPTLAVTNYTYNDGASPPTKTATTNSHWVQTAMDGFGRTVQTLNTGASVVSTQYDPCGCSPLGKVSRVSQPFAPNGSVYWTKYTYDASGRTTSVAVQETATVYSTTTYTYYGNAVGVNYPNGTWKQFTMDAFGNLTYVAEPDPALGNVNTQYVYDILNHLTQVIMPRGSNTQTRTFNYIPSGTSTVGAFLLSASNPENGTVTYTYSNGLLASKTDAKGQVFTYSYDGYNRLHQIFVGGVLLRTFMYDTNSLDGTFTSNGYGRLVAVQNAQFTPGSSNPTEFTEMYSYTIAGQPNKKRLQTNLTATAYPYPVYTANLDAAYTYDTEGKMTSVSYPNAGPTYTYSFDSMSRPIGLTDQNNYAAVSNVQYGGGSCALANELSSMSFFGVTESRCYNTRMQLTNVTVAGQLNTTYTYPSGANNGKISSQTDAISGETVSYAYDSLNRLLSAQAQVPSANLAQGKTATQSSTLSGYSTDGPGSAVDGNTDGNFFDGSVTHTNYDANAWWQVDLGSSQWVSAINIWNRTDCCSDRLTDYWVFVSDQPFSPSDTPATLQNRAGTWNNHQTTYPNPSTAITVGAEGRYVRVQLSGTNYLSLAEVQVWGGWSETFGYDAFGNLTSKTPAGGAPQLSVGVNPANNQIIGQNYDANGNQYYYNGLYLTFDAENRVLTAPGVQYAYDSRNKRVWKGTFSGSNLTAQEAYFYGVDGQKLGTYSLTLNGSQLTATTTQTAVFFGGKRVAVNGVAFVQDRLGSNSQGKFFPYGEDRGTAIANDQVKFATYTRDSATALDYADQRYYSNQFGRFMSPDPYKASTSGSNPKNPQSWNRYAYVTGDPINFNDPLGLTTCDANGNNCYDSVTVNGNTGQATWSDVPPFIQIGAGYGCNDFWCNTANQMAGLSSLQISLGNLPCPAGEVRFSYGCDVPLNPTAQAVFSLINQNGAPAFINMLGALTAIATLGPAAAEFYEAVALATSGNAILLGRTVDGYVQLGGALGAATFTIPDPVWQTMTEAEQWAANQSFLNAAIQNGSTIILGSNPADAPVGSFFWREVQYLISQGYQISAGGNEMIKP